MNNYKVINEQFRKINEWMDGWMDDLRMNEWIDRLIN